MNRLSQSLLSFQVLALLVWGVGKMAAGRHPLCKNDLFDNELKPVCAKESIPVKRRNQCT